MMNLEVPGINCEGDVTFTGVLQEFLPGALPLCIKFIQEALDKYPGMLSLETVVKQLHSGDMQLWVELENESEVIGCGVTQIVTYSCYKSVRIVLVSGEINEKWAGYLDVIGHWAQALGCAKMETRGRLGWMKKAKEFDLKPIAVFYEKTLETRH